MKLIDRVILSVLALLLLPVALLCVVKLKVAWDLRDMDRQILRVTKTACAHELTRSDSSSAYWCARVLSRRIKGI